MPARVSPVARVRAEIDQLFADPARDLGEVVEQVARLGRGCYCRPEGCANAFMQLAGIRAGDRRGGRVGAQRPGHPRQG